MSEDRHVRAELVDVLLGEVPGERLPEIDQHLSECPDCSEALERLRSVRAAVASAPLEPAPPAGLAEDVFLRVKHTGTVALLESAPLGPEPDADMANRVFADARLEKVVSLDSARERSGRTRRGLLVAGAALLVIALGFSVMRIAALSDQVKDLEQQTAVEPDGHDMQTVAVAGLGIESQLELVHFRHDNYRLELQTKDFPVQKEGHHYEVWLVGEGGETQAGSFRILRDDEITFVFNVGIDPRDYSRVEIIEEPDDGDPEKEGEVVAEGTIDPDHVEH
ncbi:MAG: anti-sigma factor [Actinomycetota bacterium]|nr:anti-sigma factor [Actinomycetota bacterium]